MNRKLTIVGLGVLALSHTAQADVDMSGYAALEQRYFLQDPAYGEQPRTQGSLVFNPEFYTEWNDGTDSLVFKPFYRVDQEDDERTHFDIRELMWLHVGEDYELRAGIGKVFWGQTESVHLVDIINQTDAVEAVDGEDKLGQPMVSYSWIGESGTITAFVMPYFRERTFAGVDGRLRPPFPIDWDDALYESSDEEQNIDYALRWQQSMGRWEIGLSYFDGTTREPELVTQIDQQGGVHLLPYYAQIEQVGVDALRVSGAWLYKFEAIHRRGQSEDFTAAVGGFEYTSVGVMNTQYDLGWLMEYQYDDREDNFFATAQNDLMVGLRWVVNDVDSTEVLLGYVQDLDESASYSAFIEASSRMTDNWRWRLDAYFFSADFSAEPDPIYFIRRDDHIQFTLEYFY